MRNTNVLYYGGQDRTTMMDYSTEEAEMMVMVYCYLNGPPRSPPPSLLPLPPPRRPPPHISTLSLICGSPTTPTTSVQ